MEILPCGCQKGNPLGHQCEEAYRAYDELRKSSEAYTTEKQTGDEDTKAKAQERLETAQKQFRSHYGIE